MSSVEGRVNKYAGINPGSTTTDPQTASTRHPAVDYRCYTRTNSDGVDIFVMQPVDATVDELLNSTYAIPETHVVDLEVWR